MSAAQNRSQKSLTDKDTALEFGKYRALPISEIDDIPYLECVVKQKCLNAFVKDAIEKQLNLLRFTHL